MVARETAPAEPLPESEYRLAVVIEETDAVAQLVGTAVDIAHHHEGELLVLTVIPKPHDSPFSVFTDETIKSAFAGGLGSHHEAALSIAADSDLTVRGRLIVTRSHDITPAIEQAIGRFDIDAVLFSWGGSEQVGRNVDRITGAQCDIIVAKLEQPQSEIESLLLPVANGPNTKCAARVAGGLAASHEAQIDLIRFVTPDASKSALSRSNRLLTEIEGLLEEYTETETLVRESTEVPESILVASRSRDLTVLGATDRSKLHRIVESPTPEHVAHNGERVIVTKSYSQNN